MSPLRILVETVLPLGSSATTLIRLINKLKVVAGKYQYQGQR